MINALVISNNIHFIKRLLKESNRHNLSIKFAEIATRKSETITILKEFKPDIMDSAPREADQTVATADTDNKVPEDFL